MYIKDLKSSVIKKILCASSVRFRWHNKNNNGGNFGINIINIKGKDYEILGYYNTEGKLMSLRFGFLFHARHPMNVNSLDEMCEFITKAIEMSE